MPSFCERCKGWFNQLKLVLKRPLPSREHLNAWGRFERFLAIRCNVTFISKVAYTTLWMCLGQANF